MFMALCMPHRSMIGTIAAFLAATFGIRGQSQSAIDSGIDVVVALDDSASMASYDRGFLLGNAVLVFLSDLRPQDRCSIVIFGDESNIALPLRARTHTDFDREIRGILNRLRYTQHYTDIPGGFAQALYELRAHGRKSAERVIVLVTDGFVDLRDRAQIAGRKLWLEQDLRREAEGSVRVFGIAFTSKADLQTLQSLASATKGDYARVDSPEDFERTLSGFRREMLVPPPAPESAPAPTLPPVPQEPPKPPIPLIWVSVWTVLGVAFVIGIAVVVLYRILIRRTQEREIIPPNQRGFLLTLPDGKERIEIARTRMLIGREDSCDIALHEEHVSEPHASIEFRGGGFFLSDLRSSHGTSVHPDRGDPHKIDPLRPEPLKHSDIITFGKVRSFVFETAAGGGTRVDPSNCTEQVPAGCFYHPTKTPQQFCPTCQRPLCSDCFTNHHCAAKRQVGA